MRFRDGGLRGAGVVVGVLCAVAAALPGSARADAQTDFYFQEAIDRYFNQPQTARTLAMGGSSRVTSTTSVSVVSNPAGLGLMKLGDLSATYSYDRISGREFPDYQYRIEDKEHIGQALLALPIGPELDALPRYGNFGIGWSQDWSDYDGDSYRGESDTYRVTAAYAKALDDDLSVGYSLTYLNDDYRSDLASYDMTNGFRYTLGVLARYSDDLLAGLSLFIGHGTHDLSLAGGAGSGESDHIEVGFDVGGAYGLGKTLLTGSIDYAYYDSDGVDAVSDPRIWFGGSEEGHVFNIRVGVEHPLTEWLLARAGYRYAGLSDYEWERPELGELNGSAKYNAWSLGAGVVISTSYRYVPVIRLDYGVEYRAIAHDDWQHMVTASAPLDLCG